MLNTKKIGLSLCTALIAGAMAVMPVCAASNNDSTSSSENTVQSIEEQMEAMDEEYEELFNSTDDSLWIKMQEAEEGISDEEYDSEDFDEKEFIQNSDALTDEEKTEITALLDQIEALNSKMDKLCEEKEEAEWEAMNEEQRAASKKVDALAEEETAIYEKHEELWAKVIEAEDNLSTDELCSESWDEAAFIKQTDALTDAEKDTLLNDLEEVEKIDEQILQLEEVIYGDTNEL